MNYKQGIFCISLDFELHWGIFDHTPIANKKSYFDNTRKCIPEILNLFKENDIEVTWATVGMLFNESINELKNGFPEVLPNYDNKKLSAYRFISEELNDEDEMYYLAPEIIKKIKKTPGQEIGTHTYSHYYTLELGQVIDGFKLDIEKCVSKAQNIEVNIKSIVFPRNQINSDYLNVCYKNGIKVIRSNPDIWFWNSKSSLRILKKVIRTLDCYVPLYKASIKQVDLKRNKSEVLLLPASRFLKPVSKLCFLNRLRIYRIKQEMTNAARKGEYYHLWWHPHNFGTYPDKAIDELKEILMHFKKLEKQYNMASLHMKNIWKILGK